MLHGAVRAGADWPHTPYVDDARRAAEGGQQSGSVRDFSMPTGFPDFIKFKFKQAREKIGAKQKV